MKVSNEKPIVFDYAQSSGRGLSVVEDRNVLLEFRLNFPYYRVSTHLKPLAPLRSKNTTNQNNLQGKNTFHA